MKRLLALLLFALPLHATLSSSAITGRVMAGEAAADGVTVTVTSAVLQQPRTTVTSARGTYWLDALPPGEYDVTFAKPGMTTLTRRAIVELGRVARADARLEPSADEESVTSTATQRSVADTTAITSHFDDATLDRLPGRDYAGVVAPDPYAPYVADIDGASPFVPGIAASDETTEQVTIMRGASPVYEESYGGRVYAVRTRAGREQFFFSLRDTLSDASWNEGGPFARRDGGLQNLVEAYGGGRIVPQRLWFFASGWHGDDATRDATTLRGVNLKLHGQLGAAHHFDAIYTSGENRFDQTVMADASSASLRHTGVYGPRLTTDTIVSHARATIFFAGPPGAPAPRDSGHSVATRASYFVPARFGDHVLTAGASLWDSRVVDARAAFLNNRWSTSRFVVNAGLRYDEGRGGDGQLTPRIAATYDLRGDGTRAIEASYGEYAYGVSPAGAARIATLGYAAAIGNSGTARVDYIRRDEISDSLQLDARYRLFDRFEAGATYTYTRFDGSDRVSGDANHAANTWLGVQLPLAGHELGVTLLQRYYSSGGEGVLPTDLALRYAVPFSRFGVTFAADVMNAFNESSLGRTVRLWVRFRSAAG
jgi:hypothetical protein